MPKKMTKERFVEMSANIHNNKYDYSRVEYIDSKTKVRIICPIHGEFWQSPSKHLSKQGCPKCKAESRKKRICEVGVNDFDGAIRIKTKHLKSYDCWRNMIIRCYDVKEQEKHPTYKGCVVCDEWLYFSNFKKWFDENYRDGYEMDKDILSKNCKCYSPQTCLFVPQYINNLFRVREDNRYGMGVRYSKKTCKYFAVTSMNGKTKYGKVFNSKEEAYKDYIKLKYKAIKRAAINALKKGDIDEKVYKALLHYEIK